MMRSRKHVMRMAHNASRPSKGKGCALVLLIGVASWLTAVGYGAWVVMT